MANKASLRQQKYDLANTKQITLKLNLKTDADILQKLETVNKQGYIKDLIRKDINAQIFARTPQSRVNTDKN